MKTLKIIAAFVLLTLTSVGAAFAQDSRGSRFTRGFERFASHQTTAQNFFNRENLAPDAPDSFGRLDPTFGTGGKGKTVLPDSDEPEQITIQPDGKLVVTGIAYNSDGSYSSSYVVRYNTNGAIDTNFADNGVFRITDTDDSLLYVTEVLPNGKLLIAADKLDSTLNVYDFAAYRLNSNGTRDTGFGTNGLITVSVSAGSDFQTYGLIVQSDGKFILAGQSRRDGANYLDVGAARLNADGTLDTSFGTNGKFRYRVLGDANNSFVSKIVAQPDGKIIILGYNYVGNFNDPKMFVTRLSANGTFDNSFGTNGTRLSSFNSFRNNASDLELQPDGKIVFTTFNFADSGFQGSTVARYNADGSTDSSFGANGAVFFPISNGENFGASILIQPNGKIILGGFVSDAPFSFAQFAYLRLNSDGSRDTSFGAGGIVRASIETYNFTTDTLFQPDGKIVAVGITQPDSSPYDIGLVRLLPDAPAAPPFFDFDGDNRADVAVYRSGVWYSINSADNSFNTTQWGIASDKIVPADFDGDRRSDLAVFRDGSWYILNSQNNSFRLVQFGQSGDVPLPGDFDGDGKADVAVFRAGVWYVQNSQNNSVRVEQFGQTGDKPISGDFDADGKQDLAVYRGGVWYVNRSTGGFFAAQFGLASDKPVAADYDGDLKTDLAVYRDGVWYIANSSNGQSRVAQFGISSDRPAPADYDGDGRADLAVFRSGTWYFLNSTNNAFRVIQFGQTGDTPVEAAYQP